MNRKEKAILLALFKATRIVSCLLAGAAVAMFFTDKIEQWTFVRLIAAAIAMLVISDFGQRDDFMDGMMSEE